MLSTAASRLHLIFSFCETATQKYKHKYVYFLKKNLIIVIKDQSNYGRIIVKWLNIPKISSNITATWMCKYQDIELQAKNTSLHHGKANLSR